MHPLAAYLPIDRLHALIAQAELPESNSGTVLVADVSGFTSLTSSLAQELGVRQGAEEITRMLDGVYEVLIEQAHDFGGSVVSFGGDAITCFFDDRSTVPAGSSARAAQAALQMHRAIASSRSGRAASTLSLHVAIEHGQVLRRLVGDPDIQLLDVMAGSVMDRLTLAARFAQKGQVVAGPLAGRALGPRLHSLATLHADGDGRYELVSGVSDEEVPGEERIALPASELLPQRLRPWLLPIVYQRVSLGHMGFLAELRPAAVMFLQFRGLDFDGDRQSGARLDAFVRWVQSAVTQAEGALLDVRAGNTTTCCCIAFGAPVAHDDDAARAVETALRLSAPPAEFDFVTGIQIGIGHGRMWAGPYGSSTRKTYGVIGDQTNLAVRLMEAAPSGRILASEAVVAASGRRELFVDRGEITLKGRERPIPVFEPCGRGHAPRVAGGRDRLIGREKECRLLQDCVDALRERGLGGVVFLEGEPGIGKSRLMGDLADRAGVAALRVATGAASAIEPSTPYFVWRAVLSDALSVTSLADPSRLEEHLRAELRDRADLVRWLPLISGILPLGIAENELTTAMAGEARAESTFTLIVALLSSVARREGGLVLALEDAHWMDSVSWALARRVSRDVPSLLLVISARPMQPVPPDAEAVLQSPRATRVIVEPLTSEGVLALVRDRLNVETVPHAVATVIEERAQGNPFFAEELASALRDRGVIQVANGRCEIAAGASLRSLEFPDTIEGVVRSRIDQLASSQQLLVKLASVIGRSFPASVLSDIYPAEADASRLQDDLDMLDRLGLVHAEVRDSAYSFRHAIIQDVAYDLLLFGQKRELHFKVAQWYERAYTGDLSPHYGLLAHHWGAAQVVPRTIHYLEKAGEQALENDANEEARRFFSEAVRLVDSAPSEDAREDPLRDGYERRARWEVRLGEAHHRMGMLGQSERHFRDALGRLDHGVPDSAPALLRGVIAEVVRQARARVRQPRYSNTAPPSDAASRLALAHAAYWRLAELSFLHGRSGLVVYGTLRSLNLAEGGGPSRELAQSYAAVCIACGLVPCHPLARLYQEKAIELAERLRDAQALADVLLTTGVYAAGVAEFAQVERRVHEAMALFERFGNFHRWGMCMQLLCRAAWSQGDFARLSTLTESLQQSGRRREDLLQQIWALNNHAEAALIRADDPLVALRACEESLSLIARCTEVAAEVISRSLIARAEIRRGNGPAALAAADAALALLATSPRPTSFGMLTAYAGTADAYLSLCEDPRFAGVGDLGRRVRTACRTMTGFASIFPIGRPWAALCEARYFMLTGRHARADARRKRALAEARRLRMPYEAALAVHTIGRNLPHENPLRSQYVEEALAVFSRLGARYDEAQARAALSPSSLQTTVS